jgi:hypothetical protein
MAEKRIECLKRETAPNPYGEIIFFQMIRTKFV